MIAKNKRYYAINKVFHLLKKKKLKFYQYYFENNFVPCKTGFTTLKTYIYIYITIMNYCFWLSKLLPLIKAMGGGSLNINFLRSSPLSVYRVLMQGKILLFSSDISRQSVLERSLRGGVFEFIFVFQICATNKTDDAPACSYNILYNKIARYDLSPSNRSSILVLIMRTLVKKNRNIYILCINIHIVDS